MASLSRLRDKGIREGKNRFEHSRLSNQLFSSYAKGKEIRSLTAILGEGSLIDVDKRYLEFAKRFEAEFINQKEDINRSIVKSLDKG